MAHIAMLPAVQTSISSLYILAIQAREDTVLPENDGLQTGHHDENGTKIFRQHALLVGAPRPEWWGSKTMIVELIDGRISRR